MIEKIWEEDPGKFASLAWSRNPATQAQINEEFIRRQKEYEAQGNAANLLI